MEEPSDRKGSWDLDDPTNTDTQQCIPAAVSRFQAYMAASFPHGHSPTTESLALNHSAVTLSLIRGQSVTAKSSSKQSSSIESHDPAHPIDICNNASEVSGSLACRGPQSSPASLKTKFGTRPEELTTAPPSSKRKRIDISPDIDTLVQNTMTWLKEKIEKLDKEVVALADPKFPPQLDEASPNVLWEWAGK